MHTRADPMLTQGMMWNSVFRSVGQIGISKGTAIPPMLSGGMQRSGTHGDGPHGPAANPVTTGQTTNAPIRMTIGTSRALIPFPQMEITSLQTLRTIGKTRIPYHRRNSHVKIGSRQNVTIGFYSLCQKAWLDTKTLPDKPAVPL